MPDENASIEVGVSLGMSLARGGEIAHKNSKDFFQKKTPFLKARASAVITWESGLVAVFWQVVAIKSYQRLPRQPWELFTRPSAG